MKKILMLCLVLVMMMAFTVPAFAVISPGAGVVTEPSNGGGPTQEGSNDSPTAPQTGSTVLFLTVAGVAVASISAAVVATKKLASEN